MDMPLLPKLSGVPAVAAPEVEAEGEAEVMPLTFDDLTEEEMGSLVAAAGGGSLEPAEGEDMEADDAGAAGGLPPGIELTEDQQAQLDAQQISTIAEGFELDIASGVQELQDMQAQAEASENGDPKGIGKLIDKATKLHEKCVAQLEKVAAAVEKADAEKAAEQAKVCEELSAELGELVAEGRGLIARQKPAPELDPDGKPLEKASPLDIYMNR